MTFLDVIKAAAIGSMIGAAIVFVTLAWAESALLGSLVSLITGAFVFIGAKLFELDRDY